MNKLKAFAIGVLAAASLAFPSLVVASSPAPRLGTAANFSVLAGSTVTNTGKSVVIGEIGLSPGTSVTGFPPGRGSYEFADAAVRQAKADLGRAFVDARNATPATNLSGKDLGNLVLHPGTYQFSSSAELTGTLTLRGRGVYIFKVGSAITTASGSRVVLEDGAQSCSLFWQIGSSATFGSGTRFAGTVMAQSSITMVTGASLVGRAEARVGAVTLDDNRISPPTGGCSGGGTTSSGGSTKGSGTSSGGSGIGVPNTGADVPWLLGGGLLVGGLLLFGAAFYERHAHRGRIA
jgi:hypothetical protein